MSSLNTYQLDEAAWLAATSSTPLKGFAVPLAQAVSAQGHALKHGHLSQWCSAIDLLPPAAANPVQIIDGAVTLTLNDDKSIDTGVLKYQSALQVALQGLMPWRKGPFRFGPVFIDTEWRSDWKWDRLAPHVSDLSGRTVLDVGCGNGYHLWRMRQTGAHCVLGIDPSLLYVKQFEATQRFVQDSAVQLLPLPMHALPQGMHVFDTVFSMGVLYHRRHPDEHLQELKCALCADGELVLETLVIPGDDDKTLPLTGRYANMRNIYELPTTTRLIRWLSEAGFTDIEVVDVTPTSRQEQRATDLDALALAGRCTGCPESVNDR